MSNLSELTDEALAKQATSGDVRAFDALFERYSDRLFRFVLTRVKNAADAEDLVQAVFVKVHRNLHRYNDAYRFSTWIYTITRRLVISYYRSAKHTDELNDRHADRAVDHPADRLSRDDDYTNIWMLARKSLSEPQMAATWLMYHEDMSIREIAHTMEKTQTHVKVLLHRARKKLAGVLEDAANHQDASTTESRDQAWASLNMLERHASPRSSRT